MADLECAALILGYLGGCDPDDTLWRIEAPRGAAHEYQARRAICDAVDPAGLRRPVEDVSRHALELRTQLRAAWRPGDI